MASQYDSIKTPKDLIATVKAHGLSLGQEDICRAQDIFGRAAIEELVELANGNESREVFYMVLFRLWNWEDATRFYNQYSNTPVIEALAMRDALTETIKDLTDDLDDCQEALNKERKLTDKMRSEMAELNEYVLQKVSLLKEKDQTIIKLKAKLYDILFKEE